MLRQADGVLLRRGRQSDGEIGLAVVFVVAAVQRKETRENVSSDFIYFFLLHFDYFSIQHPFPPLYYSTPRLSRSHLRALDSTTTFGADLTYFRPIL